MTAASPERVDYPNPPVEEALCQFAFARPVAWNVATPGLLYELLRGEYPAEPEAQEQIEASFEGPTGPSTAANLSMNRGTTRYVYRDDDRQRLIVCNPSLLSVNSLRPYEGWPALRERIGRAIELVAPVLGEPEVQKVSIRYINRIVIPEEAVNTDDYFTVSIHTVNDGTALLAGFVHRVQSVIDDRTIAISTFASLEPDPPGLRAHAYILDLDFQRTFDEPTSMTRALAEAEELKVLESREFESCIRDATRELFK